MHARKKEQYTATGGNGGGGGGGGGFTGHGEPVDGKDAVGCPFGDGGNGGRGGLTQEDAEFLLAKGGEGGRGFPGEVVVKELTDMSEGEVFAIMIGEGGDGGSGGRGKQPGEEGGKGKGGYVFFVPLFGSEG
ncbi:MAG: hypothetical protein OXN90_16220 [Gemmatimonadota bacterium]|nr:hypothetical protein [Gemmatimonadota bacterium]